MFMLFLFFFLFSVTFLLLLLLLVLLRLLFVLHSRVLLLWLLSLLMLLFVLLRSRLLFFKGGHLSRTWFASFGVGCSSWVALESFLPPTALATMMLLKKFLTIMLTLSVFTPIRILTVKTLPVLRTPLIPPQPSRSIPGFGSDNIAGSISVIWSPTVIRAVKIVQDGIQKPITGEHLREMLLTNILL